MGNNYWRDVTLKEVADVNPDSIDKKWPYDHISYIDISSVGQGYISIKPAFISLVDAPSRAKRRVRLGDTVLSTVRPNRRSMFYASDPSPDWIVSTGFAVIRPKQDMISPRYLYSCVFNQTFTDYLVAHEIGAAYPAVSVNDILNAPIHLPPRKEQDAIAGILGALDDKIELNRQICKTLEETAQAIFKSWFVDFDPVHAKAAGKQPQGMNPEIAELFPDSFEDSDFGKIPKGWKVSTLDDVITRIPVGKKYEQKTANSKGQVPILDQGQSGIIGYHDNEPGVIASKDKPIIVFANHTCYMRLIYYPFSAIQNVLPFVGNGINTIWLYYATLGKQTFTEYKGHWPDLIRQHICAPNMRLDDRFSDIVTPILWKIWGCFEENDTLGSIRDSLLPRLISGELKVKDAEKIASRLV